MFRNKKKKKKKKDVLVNDLSTAHTLSKHNHDALLNGSQHTCAWRVYWNRTKPYWYPDTAHYNALCIISLHFPNLLTDTSAVLSAFGGEDVGQRSGLNTFLTLGIENF